ncbi:hypothetical protein ACFQY7_25780 [Actinomadura luteofluorescens]|uniref:hypothetical protein n=1 Tax=Actinomadura luteofluorescens TaxID=46163 RepID=UPI00362F7402
MSKACSGPVLPGVISTRQTASPSVPPWVGVAAVIIRPFGVSVRRLSASRMSVMALHPLS